MITKNELRGTKEWKHFVEYREQLKRNGMSPKMANKNALAAWSEIEEPAMTADDWAAIGSGFLRRAQAKN